jgi:hypothetical protein
MEAERSMEERSVSTVALEGPAQARNESRRRTYVAAFKKLELVSETKPYPSLSECEELADEFGCMTAKQVRTWFQNRRQRVKMHGIRTRNFAFGTRENCGRGKGPAATEGRLLQPSSWLPGLTNPPAKPIEVAVGVPGAPVASTCANLASSQPVMTTLVFAHPQMQSASQPESSYPCFYGVAPPMPAFYPPNQVPPPGRYRYASSRTRAPICVSITSSGGFQKLEDDAVRWLPWVMTVTD